MKPNIIVVLSDQQRWDTLGYAGVQKNITPNLDRIGKEGTLFKNCFTVQPVCGPARACIQSGRYATETGNYANGCSLPQDCDTVAKYIHQAGYDTAYIGKWHLYKKHSMDRIMAKYDVPIQDRAGYDFWQASNMLEYTSHAYDGYVFDTNNKKIPIKGYRADFLTDLTLKYLKGHKKEKPFLLFLSFIEPHQQNDLNKFTGPTGSKDKYKDFAIPGDFIGKKGDYMENMPDYLGMCANLDENVGRLEEYLKQTGEWDNTVFLYSSDHACHFQTRNGEYKRSCHDASIHIPLIVHGPGLMGNGEKESLVSILDIPATMLHAAKLQVPKAYRGIPLQEMDKQNRDSVFIQISEDTIGRSIRTKDWKYCVTYDEDASVFEKPSAKYYYESHLYDLKNDPDENVNLVNDPSYTDTRAKLQKRLLQYIREVEKETPEIRSADEDTEANKKYSFRMSLQEMLDDEKSYEVVKRVMPILINNKRMKGAQNLKFSLIEKHLRNIPVLGGMMRRLKLELEKLNNMNK